MIFVPSSRLIALLTLVAAHASTVYGNVDLAGLNMNDIQQQLPAQLSNSNVTMEDAKKLLRDKCVAVAGEQNGTAAFEEIESGAMAMFECATNIVNFTAIQAEIEEASPHGELDVVFHKYCLKRPEAIGCYEAFNAKLVPCLDQEEQENQVVFMRIVRSLLNFICHKGGDQIALFIAEKGPECLDSKREDIQQCVNTTFSNYLPKDGLESMKTLPKFVLSQKLCDDLEVLQQCVVKRLEMCSEITPANIVESMFRFVKNETICRATTGIAAKQSGVKNAAASNGLPLVNVGQLVMTSVWLAMLAARNLLAS